MVAFHVTNRPSAHVACDSYTMLIVIVDVLKSCCDGAEPLVNRLCTLFVSKDAAMLQVSLIPQEP